jgi:hypothetical protein
VVAASVNHEDFPRLTFDRATGQAHALDELSDAQYTTLVATSRCPVVLAATEHAPAARCREPLLLPCVEWSGTDAGHRSLTGDWLCADGHGPADYLASLPPAT